MRVAVIGGSGYGAIELIKFLYNHPLVELETVISHSQSGIELKEVFPHVTNIVDKQLEIMDIKNIANRVELVFFATPSGVSSMIIPEFIESGVKCIDLSGDFRLISPNEYESWYKKVPAPQMYLNQAVYGLSEINRGEIKDSKLIANPGCYPTATLLGLIPAIKAGIIDLDSIIIDAKSGVSGAGRSLSLTSHYAEINENLKAYKLGSHQHIPEIEQVLSVISGQKTPITFTTHLVPMTRGIMCTIYASLIDSKSEKDIEDLYNTFYESAPFVRVRSNGILPSTKEVSGSNYCDIGFHVEKRTGRLTIISVIDNLVKGAAGQAIQNMNITNGWDEQMGLLQIPMYP